MLVTYRKTVISFCVAVLTGVVFTFQACGGPVQFQSVAENFKASDNGNGGSYGGKPGFYLYFDESDPCAVDASGVLYPNRQINVAADHTIALVRDACMDIAPVALDPSVIQFHSTGLVYQNQFFLLH